jgi:16S rRNA processing protein RimM
MASHLVVGFVCAPHGLTGRFRVESASGETKHFLRMTEITLRNRDAGERVFTVERSEAGPAGLFFKLAGIDSPEEARKLSGMEILVPREAASPLRGSERYVDDLRQCALVYAPGGFGTEITVGIVEDVLDTGAGSMLEVLLSEGAEQAGVAAKTRRGEARTVLVPYLDKFIGTVDTEGKRVDLKSLWILE